MTTFNTFKFQNIDSTSTTTVEVCVDGCQEVVDQFISFMRGCGYMDVNIYASMSNAVEEYDGYTNSLKNGIESSLYEPKGR
jgi:acetolactate synthase small subunit